MAIQAKFSKNSSIRKMGTALIHNFLPLSRISRRKLSERFRAVY